jgi:pimeloyl-ACP methyl ester carboxylesterase
VPDLYAFVQAVQAYTGSAYVDIVAHSLGVTITRKMMQDYPQLYNQVLAAVMIAGANHGTTVCRQPAPQYYYGCDEIGPGQPWLDSLNATGESPGPTCWMTVYDGLEGDPFYVGPDEQSPHLRGAYNTQWPMYYHNDLRVDPHIVPAYRDFVETYGQPGHASCPVQD